MNNKRIALVVGGSGGIGQSIVKRLSSDGYDVHSTYNKNSKFNLDTVTHHFCDVKDEKNISKLINDITNDSKYIDLIVFSVTPHIANSKFFDLHEDEIINHFKVQVLSLTKIIGLLKDQFEKKHKTKIITILTEYCFGTPPKNMIHYLISKYALLGLSKGLAVELANYNSTVNMVSPGIVDTDLIKHLPPKFIELAAYQNPLGRIANVKDISNIISFLGSDESDYLNGVNIPVNGGNSIL